MHTSRKLSLPPPLCAPTYQPASSICLHVTENQHWVPLGWIDCVPAIQGLPTFQEVLAISGFCLWRKSRESWVGQFRQNICLGQMLTFVEDSQVWNHYNLCCRNMNAYCNAMNSWRSLIKKFTQKFTYSKIIPGERSRYIWNYCLLRMMRVWVSLGNIDTCKWQV